MATAVITPVPKPMVATAVVPLVHVPPPPSLNVVVPVHNVVVPEIADGEAFIVTTAVS